MKFEVHAFAFAAAITAALWFGAMLAVVVFFPETVVNFVNLYFQSPHITGFVITPYNAALGFAKTIMCSFVFGGIFAFVYNKLSN